MKILHLLFLMMLIPITPAQAAHPKVETITLTSEKGHPYLIQTMVTGAPPENGYPTIYLLDGNTSYSPAAMTASDLAKQHHSQIAALIVSIGYPDTQLLNPSARARDYTPPSAQYTHTGDKFNHEFGGAEDFHQFIQTILKTALQTQYPLDDTKQAIFGHSYGGLFVLYELFNHSENYQYYYAASPSIWWNQKRILDFQNQAIIGKPYLWLANGEYEQTLAPDDKHPDSVEKLKTRDMIGNAQRLKQVLEKRRELSMVQHHIYPKKRHSDVMIPAIIDSLTHWFQQLSQP